MRYSAIGLIQLYPHEQDIRPSSYPASREKQNGAQTEFLTFFQRENGKLFAFHSLHRIKNTIIKHPQIVYRLANEFLKFKMVK